MIPGIKPGLSVLFLPVTGTDMLIFVDFMSVCGRQFSYTLYPVLILGACSSGYYLGSVL